jgi:hypothetical protein
MSRKVSRPARVALTTYSHLTPPNLPYQKYLSRFLPWFLPWRNDTRLDLNGESEHHSTTRSFPVEQLQTQVRVQRFHVVVVLDFFQRRHTTRAPRRSLARIPHRPGRRIRSTCHGTFFRYLLDGMTRRIMRLPTRRTPAVSCCTTQECFSCVGSG